MRLAGVVGDILFRHPNRPLIVDDMPALVPWDGGESETHPRRDPGRRRRVE